ncbi:hypothetical protein GJAV_G00026740 [Gymnothorax javanicus]|nr:hypothetical protein GJAV_G00026740 [Gymnothorax javanicus]
MFAVLCWQPDFRVPQTSCSCGSVWCFWRRLFARAPVFHITVAMGGLGNGRRGGRAPPLLIGALIACILVLGFNYWVSSSRNLELQARLFEMEGGMRRAVGEKGAIERKNKEFEEELRLKGEHLSQMEDRHKIQLESAMVSWKQEKAVLVLNVTSSTKIIQTLKAQLEHLGEIQKELQACQTSQTDLSTAVSECTAQMDDLKKECAAKTSLLEKSPPASQASVGPSHSLMGQLEKPGPDDTKKPQAPFPKTSRMDTEPEVPKESARETNEISKARDGDALPSLTGKILSKSANSMAPVPIASNKNDIPRQERTPSVAKQGVGLEVIETHIGQPQAEGNAVISVEKENKRGDEPEKKPGERPEKPGERPADLLNASNPDTLKLPEPLANAGKDQVIGRSLADLKKELADYNGDDENEGESEADKQAELAKH